MTEPNEREVILSIETAVEGGSLSVLRNEIEIDGWSGTLEISKAEDVLEQTAKLLSENNIERNQIKLISVSKDVGSLTGRKIGLALAKGLTKSLKCGLVEISLLEALLLEVKENFEGACVTAAASGRNNIWWQIFRMENDNCFKETSSPQISSKDEFYKIIKQIDFEKSVFASDILRKDLQISNASLNQKQRRYIISKLSPANIIGLKAYQTRV